MAKLTMDYDEWIRSRGWGQAQIEEAHRRLKKRELIYGLLSVLLGQIYLVPFWVRANYLKRAIELRDLDVNPSFFPSVFNVLYMIGFLFIIPLIQISIIKNTDWGMGIKKL